MRTPTKKRKTPIKETKSVSVSTTSTPVKTSPKARRNLKLSDVEEEDVAMLKGEKGKKTHLFRSLRIYSAITTILSPPVFGNTLLTL